MLSRETCALGLKVLIGIGTGALVILGLLRKPKQPNPTVPPQTGPGVPQQPTPPEQQQENTGSKIIDGINKAQVICSKTLSVIQTVSMASQSLDRIFNGPQPQSFPGQGYYNNAYPGANPWTGNNGSYYPQQIDMGNGQYWTRISPFIVEVPPQNPSYGYGGGYGNNGYPI